MVENSRKDEIGRHYMAPVRNILSGTQTMDEESLILLARRLKRRQLVRSFRSVVSQYPKAAGCAGRKLRMN